MVKYVVLEDEYLFNDDAHKLKLEMRPAALWKYDLFNWSFSNNKIICMREASVTLHGFVVSRSMYYNLSINFSSNSTKQMAFDEIIIYTRIYDTLNQPSDFSNVTTATPSLNNRTLSTSPPPFLFF